MKDSTRALLGIVLIVMSGVLWVATGATIPSYDLDVDFGGGNDLPAGVEANHTAALAEEGSYITNSTVINRGYRTVDKYAVNASAGEAVHHQTAGDTTTSWYTVGETTYKRTEDGTTTNATAVNTTTATGVENIVATGATYSFKGNETYQGHEVARYEGTGVTDMQVFSHAFRAQIPAGTEIDDFSATLLIDKESSIVRSHTWSVTLDVGGQMIDLSGAVHVRDIGNTSVQTPQWAQ